MPPDPPRGRANVHIYVLSPPEKSILYATLQVSTYYWWYIVHKYTWIYNAYIVAIYCCCPPLQLCDFCTGGITA